MQSLLFESLAAIVEANDMAPKPELPLASEQAVNQAIEILYAEYNTPLAIATLA